MTSIVRRASAAEERVTRQTVRDLLADLEAAERQLRSVAEYLDGEVSAKVERALHDVTAVADRLFGLMCDHDNAES
jgi:hypothetical protein